jgi:rare lipoprotein A
MLKFSLTLAIAWLLVFASPVQSASVGDTATGIAAYYSNVFHGRRTASGERYDKNAYTAAHKRLLFGTRVRVTNLENGKSVVLKINDRGPRTQNRIIDVSRRAALDLGFIRKGLTEVQLEVIEVP